MGKVSIVIPAKNESLGLNKILPKIISLHPEFEVIVVNDGSTDETVDVCKSYFVKVISHAYSQGNGAAIKTGIRHAIGEVVVFMDADGQHKPEDIAGLLAPIYDGYDMVVGARSSDSQASHMRAIGNGFYNRLASWVVENKIADLTSGFRAIRSEKIKPFLYLLPNKFSYPTTITMSFFRAGFTVKYSPIIAETRLGKSHLNVWKDGVRFLLIIFKIGTLYSPLKIFTPISLFFFLMGLSYYSYTFISFGRFTNMSALLLVTSVIVFLMGLISEQITNLLYSQSS